MIRGRPRFVIMAFFALLLVVDSFLYFRHAGHFFAGDAVFLLHHRAVSVSDYLKEFVQLNPSGWYRPLANELIQSVLYPIVGLRPVPYRIPVYLTFVIVTVLVYMLVLALSGRHLPSGIAAFFFTIHTANAYTTYDVSFMPELLYASFYLAAMLAFFRYLQNGSRIAYGVSLVSLVAALLSKESAVTLPITLLALCLTFDPSARSVRDRAVRALGSTAPHMIILLVYLTYAVGYLHVMGTSVTKLVGDTQVPNPGDYIAVLNGGMLKTADLAFTWAFNIPRAYSAQFQNLTAGMMGYLKFFRAFVLLLVAIVLVRSERRLILFGFAFFWIVILPALTLIGHFLPYYVFLPVAGLSLIIGSAFTWLYDQLRRIHVAVAALTLGLLLGGVLYVNRSMIRTDIEHNGILGASAELARSTLNDVKRLYPVLPADARLYFADGNESLLWHHDSGALLQMAYETNKITALYESQGDSPFSVPNDVLVFRLVKGRLIDETANYRANPLAFIKFTGSDRKIELSTTNVTAGEKYTLSIAGLSDVPVRIAYTMNEAPLETFSAHLDAHGSVTFDVTKSTGRGLYRFLGFNVVGTADWVRADAALTVR